MRTAMKIRQGIIGTTDPITAKYDALLDYDPVVLLPMDGAAYTSYRGQQLFFQDPAGTTPATEVGDPVGAMVDLVSGEILAVQTDDASRPVLGADGLIFDGGDWLDKINGGDITSSMSHAVAFRFTRDVTANFDRVYELRSSAGEIHFVQIRGDERIRVLYQDENGDRSDLVASFDVDFPVWGAGETKSLVAQYNTTEERTELWVDGVLIETQASSISSDFAATDSATIGAGAGGTNASEGVIHSLAEYIGPALSPTEIAAISELL